MTVDFFVFRHFDQIFKKRKINWWNTININVENPEYQSNKFLESLPKIQIYYTKLWTQHGTDAQNWSAWFSEFSTFIQLTLDMGVFIRSMGSPDYKDLKIAMEELIFAVPDSKNMS